jgi:hypothetical protein
VLYRILRERSLQERPDGGDDAKGACQEKSAGDMLLKYYDNPEKYSVEDFGGLR